jgi:hypothetical protein
VAAGRELSIVVVPLLGQDALSNCLDRLPLASVECIVVLCRRMGPVSAWQARYPSVIFLLASREPVPLRRLCGIRAARGDVVGLIEDTSWPDADWCAAALSALAGRRTAAAGGSVRIERIRGICSRRSSAAFGQSWPRPAGRRVPHSRQQYGVPAPRSARSDAWRCRRIVRRARLREAAGRRPVRRL